MTAQTTRPHITTYSGCLTPRKAVMERTAGSRAARLVFCISLVTLVCGAEIQAEQKPNILMAFADDWGRYASAYAKVDGPGTVNDAFQTPHFDRIAGEGVLFRSAFVTAPSCTPCRSSLLSGQYFYRTGLGAILQGAEWDSAIPSYPLLLREQGYHIGQTYKVWTPGTPRDAPYGAQTYAFESRGSKFNGFSQHVTRMVAEGLSIDAAKQKLLDEVAGNFEDFLAERDPDQPFCYWFGPTNVHRKWIAGSGKSLWNIEPDDLKQKLPAFLPDVPVVREDFADYLGEAKAFDTALGVLIAKLEERGELDNTLVVVSGDHGAPGFPRGKCNLYDFGVAVPLAMRFGDKIQPGRVIDDLVNLMDLAPTFLDVAKAPVPSAMTGRSLLPLLQSDREGQIDPSRTWVVTGRERHVGGARAGRLPYPQRALRTKEYLYIVNFRPDRFPMGDPKVVTPQSAPHRDVLTNDTFVAFGDLDASPTKAWMIAHRHDEPQLFQHGFGKRPSEELYVLAEDPDQLHNVAGDPEHATIKHELRRQLLAELVRTGDPRVTGDGMQFERLPFTGGQPLR